MSVVDSVQTFLGGLGDLGKGPEAAAALVLAEQLDDSENSATSKSMCARELREAVARLREMAPPKEKKGELHDIKSARARRLSGGSAGA